VTHAFSRSDRFVLFLLIIFIFLVLPPGWAFFVLLIKKAAFAVIVALIALLGLIVFRSLTRTS
jgi:hypothetical protein